MRKVIVVCIRLMDMMLISVDGTIVVVGVSR